MTTRMHHPLALSCLATCAVLALAACRQPAAPADTTSAVPAEATPATAGTDATPEAGGPAREATDADEGASQPAGESTPAVAAEDDSAINQTIDEVLGDHAAYRDAFDRLQRGVASGDKEAVAALVSYPIEVQVGGRKMEIADAKQFVAHWDQIITPDIAKVITEQNFSGVTVNWRGMMLGDGQVWLNGVCRDSACKDSDVRVVAIQPAP